MKCAILGFSKKLRLIPAQNGAHQHGITRYGMTDLTTVTLTSLVPRRHAGSQCGGCKKGDALWGVAPLGHA
jgi:hypothetical protein